MSLYNRQTLFKAGHPEIAVAPPLIHSELEVSIARLESGVLGADTVNYCELMYENCRVEYHGGQRNGNEVHNDIKKTSEYCVT